MIENKTVMRQEDIVFGLRRSMKPGVRRITNVVLVISGILVLVSSVVLVFAQQRAGHFGTAEIFRLVFGILVCGIAFVGAFAFEPVLAAVLRLFPAYKAEICYRFNADGLTVSAAGIPQEKQIPYSSLQSCTSQNGALYLCVNAANGKAVYLCLRDDSYTQGSREVLTALLNANGVAQA
ncbi:MAG: hypothetical protein K6F80_06440 [Oscillospiraceae bacterium]|nr:hypothetical protein [Oscillospiraceae bacterium]